MDTEHIAYLQAVAEHGSISAAARALNLNQPHLTKVLRRLEQEFGVRFFERGARGVTLTPYGERFLLRARVVQREMSDIGAELRSLRGGQRGHVTVGAGQTWLTGMLPDAIAECSRRMPEVTIGVSTGSRMVLMEQLRNGEIDVYLGTVDGHPMPGIDVQPITTVSFKLTARRDHPLLRDERPLTPQALTEFGWILPPEADPTQVHLRSVMAAHGMQPPRTQVEAVSFNFVIHTLRRSDMLAMLPDIGADGDGNGLVSLDLDWLNATRRVGAHIMSGRILIPAAHLFIDRVRAVATRVS